MRSLSISLAVGLAVTACSGGSKSSKTPAAGSGSGSDAEAVPQVIAQTLVGWGRQPASGGKTHLFLEVTDHTGGSKSYPLGDVSVPCQVATGKDDIITSLLCLENGSGTELRAVYRSPALIVLRRAVDPADNPDDIELSFREVTRVDIPVGAAVRPAVE